jgi:hypothetical protein
MATVRISEQLRAGSALLINGVATFQKKYGSLQPDGTYQISAAWESGLSNGAAIGEILGLMTTGLIAERYGYRKTIGMALFLVVCKPIHVQKLGPSTDVALIRYASSSSHSSPLTSRCSWLARSFVEYHGVFSRLLLPPTLRR